MLVIKIGGGAAIGEGGYTNFAGDLATITEPVVVVHGGNAEFSDLSRRLGMPPRMITSSTGRVTRYTDAATMDSMLMAYCGKVNKRLVATLRAAGVNAVGLSAIDGGIALGRRKPVLRGTEDGKSKVLRDDHAGTWRQSIPRSYSYFCRTATCPSSLHPRSAKRACQSTSTATSSPSSSPQRSRPTSSSSFPTLPASCATDTMSPH